MLSEPYDRSVYYNLRYKTYQCHFKQILTKLRMIPNFPEKYIQFTHK